MNIKQKLITTITSGAMVLSAITPVAFAGSDVTISGNGSRSDNSVSVRQDTRTNVSQRNNADINNSVDVRSGTGGNRANANTGGSVTLRTGDSNTAVDIQNKANSNQLSHGSMNHDNNGNGGGGNGGNNGGNGNSVDGRGRTRTNVTGFTDGWFDGKTVKFFYSKFAFFCKEPPASGADSNCEGGEEAQSKPRGGNIPVLYVMTPLGFSPTDQSTLQCPEVGNCINHPKTIDVSRVLGAGTENLPLPAHSHIVEEDTNGWWELEVVGVKDQATWDKVVAGKSLETVRALQADAANANKITGDIPTNSFLFFNVL